MITPTIRLARPSDAEPLLDLMRRLDRDSSFMMLEPGERTTTAKDLSRRLEPNTSGNSLFWVAEVGGKLAGYVSATRGEFRRNKHSVWLVIGVARDMSGKGLGSRLLEEVDHWAPANGVSRLELTVMTHNEAALHLYKKTGFLIEGVRRNSLLVGGAFVDEYQMAKLLEAGSK